MDKPEGNAAFILHFKGDTLYDLGDKQSRDVVFDGKVKEKTTTEVNQKEENVVDDEDTEELDDFIAFGKKK